MTDRQRAFVCSLVYVAKNKRFQSHHGIGVKRLPDGGVMYEFRGEWLKDSISVQDDKYNRVFDSDYLSNPWGVKVRWQGKLVTVTLKIVIPEEGSQFYGHDGDYYRFEGTYHASSSNVEIRDQSQDRYKYAYRIIW